ncbi:MAG: BlaI/MecI/CopY family transcriptional regulator [Kangiellaceae bacterium]|nr:BlaI/MecI/CopY family transcriptional regulator [Kangiellaceae bacterium]
MNDKSKDNKSGFPTSLPDLSRTELQILNVIWKNKEGLSVREVHEQIIKTFKWAYSTTKTTMDRMVKKGLLRREDFHGVFLYQAEISKPAGLARLISFFMNDLLEMDQSALVSLFGQSKALTASEVDELESLLEEQSGQSEMKSNTIKKEG